MEDLGFQSLAYVIPASRGVSGAKNSSIITYYWAENHNSQFTIFRRCMISSLSHLWLSYHSSARQQQLAEARKHTRNTIPPTSSRSGDSVYLAGVHLSLLLCEHRGEPPHFPPINITHADFAFPEIKSTISGRSGDLRPSSPPPRIKPVMHRRSRVGACTAAR
jgi:hypothetical protein